MMTDQIAGGGFWIARKIFRSAIWGKAPQLLRFFLLLVGKAAFQDGHAYRGHVLKRGELITTYNEISDVLSYCFNHAIVKPTLKEIRIMLSWLQSEGMILVKPLIDGTLTNKGRDKGRPPTLTRAYIGLLIYIINYDTYQNSDSYKGRDKGRPPLEQGQLAKKGENNKGIYSENSLQVLAYLNDKTGKRFRHASYIEARLKDGGTVDDCRKVIDNKIKDPFFIGNPKYLNPVTLFRKSHWDTYLNETQEVKHSSW